MENLFLGYGYKPYFVEGDEPLAVHEEMATTLDTIIARNQTNQKRCQWFVKDRPQWPMIILRTPKGWTGPKFVDGLPIEGTWRSHQVPLTDFSSKPDHIKILEDWMRSYKPEELFDEQGQLMKELRQLAPEGEQRMSANPHANGGLLLKDLRMPDFTNYAIAVQSPGKVDAEATRIAG